MRPYVIVHTDGYEPQVDSFTLDLDHVQGFSSPIITYPLGRPVWKFHIRLAFHPNPIQIFRRIPLYEVDGKSGGPVFAPPPDNPGPQFNLDTLLLECTVDDPLLLIDGVRYFNVQHTTMKRHYDMLMEPFYRVYADFEEAWRHQPQQAMPPYPGPHYDPEETEITTKEESVGQACCCDNPRRTMGSVNCKKCGLPIRDQSTSIE